MNQQQQIDLAKKALKHIKYKGTTTFRNVPLEHFNELELSKIVELALQRADRERKLHTADREMLQTFADARRR
jgi:hypothetical protein